jgi:hypothetical protein
MVEAQLFRIDISTSKDAQARALFDVLSGEDRLERGQDLLRRKASDPHACAT